MQVRVQNVNNPRKEDGSFGRISCSVCGWFSGAYTKITTVDEKEIGLNRKTSTIHTIMVCGNCLESWVSGIHETILQDAIRKGNRNE